MTYEMKTFKELGFTETYVRNIKPEGWNVCSDENGNKFAVRASNWKEVREEAQYQGCY